MKSSIHLLIGLFVLSLGSFNMAYGDSKRPDHFKGKASPTLEEAVANFSEYNGKLAAILTKDELSPQDVQQVHELTYTLENALEKIRAEFAGLAEALEALHVASEHADIAMVKVQGKAYLDSARKVVK